ncbi:hypothetical protein [Nostoc sp.]|uniref:hypothetical protein n=1 Tax=Nostoc sp. TaxID=1180 RepID=UPI002FFCDDBC
MIKTLTIQQPFGQDRGQCFDYFDYAQYKYAQQPGRREKFYLLPFCKFPGDRITTTQTADYMIISLELIALKLEPDTDGERELMRSRGLQLCLSRSVQS